MKKIVERIGLRLTVIAGIIFVMVAVGLAWYVINNKQTQKVTAKVDKPQELEMVCSDQTGNLTILHGNAVSFYDEDGNAATDYWHETVTLTFDGTKEVYFDGITCEGDILPALRVVIDKKIYAGEGFTTGIKVNDMLVLPQTSGSLGTYTDKAVLDVTVFLEGEDAACTNANLSDEISFELNFSVDE